jgi:hypothetical protein
MENLEKYLAELEEKNKQIDDIFKLFSDEIEKKMGIKYKSSHQAIKPSSHQAIKPKI